MDRSRIPKFYQANIPERLEILRERGILNKTDFYDLLNGDNVLTPEQADKMIENVIGVFGLPIGLGLNFLINDRAYLIPMVVEEPSIVAAVSSAAKTVRDAGGFRSSGDEPVMIGQIQIVDVAHSAKVQHAILQNKDEIINLANSLHPRMIARGGGVKDLEVVIHPGATYKGDMVVVHLIVDTGDAMGANLVNSMCEGVASLVEKISDGKVFLRILSNLTDRAMVRASCRIPAQALDGKGYTGEEVRDGIILANEFASVDPYRAATHNKGIMNGIDAVALATGNDWRAIESSVHAYAARGKVYTSLTRWSRTDDGDLHGVLEIPLKVGIVGGSLESNPGVGIAHRILNTGSAKELAEVMGAVGLAQNFAALRALVTEGIQQGHMTLHARSVAVSAGAPPEIFDDVVEKLVEDGEIKVWRAREIISNIQSTSIVPQEDTPTSVVKEGFQSGYGKVILIGEHAVVYGTHAVAAPINLAMQAKVWESNSGVHLIIPRWGVEEKIQPGADHKYSIYKSLELILEKLELRDRNIKIEVLPNIPRAMGLGGSASLAVAIIRALDSHFRLGLADEDINRFAYESENLVHGSASGIDNTMATYGRFTLFQKSDPPVMKDIHAPEPIPIVIGLTGVESLTAKMVSLVRNAWENNKSLYNRIFGEIDDLALQSAEAIESGNIRQLGEFMNINQGLLNALQVSSKDLELLIDVARRNGAIGAKLTGAGGGGAMLALCPDDPQKIALAMRKAGYDAIITAIGQEKTHARKEPDRFIRQ
jgi:hydroxymethylglutaryl-CoA reductase